MSWFGESTRHREAAKKRNSFSSIASRPISHKIQKAFYVREMKKELAKSNPDRTVVNYYRTQARIQSKWYRDRV